MSVSVFVPKGRGLYVSVMDIMGGVFDARIFLDCYSRLAPESKIDDTILFL